MEEKPSTVSSYWENIIQAPGSVRIIQTKNAIFLSLNASASQFRKAAKHVLKSVFRGTDSYLLSYCLAARQGELSRAVPAVLGAQVCRWGEDGLAAWGSLLPEPFGWLGWVGFLLETVVLRWIIPGTAPGGSIACCRVRGGGRQKARPCRIRNLPVSIVGLDVNGLLQPEGFRDSVVPHSRDDAQWVDLSGPCPLQRCTPHLLGFSVCFWPAALWEVCMKRVYFIRYRSEHEKINKQSMWWLISMPGGVTLSSSPDLGHSHI